MTFKFWHTYSSVKKLLVFSQRPSLNLFDVFSTLWKYVCFKLQPSKTHLLAYLKFVLKKCIIYHIFYLCWNEIYGPNMFCLFNMGRCQIFTSGQNCMLNMYVRILYSICFIHTLQLIFKDSLFLENSISVLIAKARKTVGHFNHSSTACEKLKKIKNTLGS